MPENLPEPKGSLILDCDAPLSRKWPIRAGLGEKLRI